MPITDTEPELAEMEYALRRQRASSWYDKHDVGFEELESDDNGQKALGVRVFNVSGEFFYAPIFFNDGDLMGEELLYSKSDDLFVPFVEEWTQFILRKQSDEVGESFDGEYEATEPDMSPLVEAPDTASGGGGKSIKAASHIVKKARKASREGVDVDLAGALRKAGAREKGAFMVAMQEFPKAAEHVCNNIPNLLDLLRVEKAGPGAAEKSAADEPTADNKKKLNTKVVDADDEDYATPTSTGVYELFLRTGKAQPVLLIRTRHASGTTASDIEPSKRVIVVDPDNNRHSYENYEKLCAKTTDSPEEDWREWFDGLSDSDIQNKRSYVFVGPEPGQCTGIVNIRHKVKKGNGHIAFNEASYVPVTSKEEFPGYVDYGLITGSDGKHEIVGDRLVIPGNYKAIRVNRKREGAMEPFATPDDLILKEGTPLYVDKKASSYVFEHEGETRSAINEKRAIDLMKDEYGLNEKLANAVLHDFNEVGREMFLIKKAQQLPPLEPAPGPGMPAGPAGPPPAGPGGPPPAGPMGPPPGPEGQEAPEMDPAAREAMNAAINAEEAGVKGPIETAMLSNMAHVSDNAQFIRGHLGNLMKAMDSWGSILYRVYSDYDEFEEDIGSNELSDIVDSIKELFTSSGQNIIKLKEKLSGPEDLRIELG